MRLDTLIALQDVRVQTFLRTPYQPADRARLGLCQKPSMSRYAMGCRCAGCREQKRADIARRREVVRVEIELRRAERRVTASADSSEGHR